ncbi:MAG: hypothetical protein K0R18_506 [Bacillales bacterium]|jgi:hypothetical protein|nr:hypothetical protein [Bacillales bacterium]
MINIYCDDACPICDSRLIDKSSFSVYRKGAGYWYICPNVCFSHMFVSEKTKKIINGSESTNYFELLSGQLYTINKTMSKDELRSVEDAVRSEIVYWKQDEKYLMRIMTNG